MPKKKPYSIGTDVVNKGKNVIPSKVELTIKPPSPLDFMQLKLLWEKKEKRELSEEEFRRRLEEYMKKVREKKRKRKHKLPKQVKYI
jgi:hypothetical protein